MKIICTIFFIFISISDIYTQQDLFGIYRDNFGNQIELRNDSTFLFEFHFDMSYSWTIGTWCDLNDTIIFKIKPVLDTLRQFYDVSKNIKDTLVLSRDDKIVVINSEDAALSSMSSGGQNRVLIPKKMYFKKGKLYKIDDKGKLKTKKVRDFGIDKKYDPWFILQ